MSTQHVHIQCLWPPSSRPLYSSLEIQDPDYVPDALLQLWVPQIIFKTPLTFTCRWSSAAQMRESWKSEHFLGGNYPH